MIPHSRFLKLFLLACACAATSDLHAQTASLPAKGALRIGAWNVENLGTEDPAQKPEDLAEYILSSGVDVMSIEEIHDDDQKTDDDKGKAPWRNKIIDDVLKLLQAKTSAEWQYLLTDPSPDNAREQMTGVLWRTDRVTFQKRYRLPVAGGMHEGNPKYTYWTRRPEAFLFSAGKPESKHTDFVLIPLHMKSNSGGAVGPLMRTEEAKQLLTALPELAKQWKGEKDIVMLGDTNILEGQKDVQSVWKDFRDLNSAEMKTWYNPKGKYPPAPFDRIFVPNGQPEFKDSAEHVHAVLTADGKPDEAWLQKHHDTRSDHLLVWCDLAVMPDDD
jgi:hypothetical protein